MVKTSQGITGKQQQQQELIKEVVYTCAICGKVSFTKGELINDGCFPGDIKRAIILLDCSKEAYIEQLKTSNKLCRYNNFTGSPSYQGTVWMKTRDDGAVVFFNKERATAPEPRTFIYSDGYVPATMPCTVTLERNREGYLFRSHSLRPDIWGFSEHPEKVFFVDKTCLDSVMPGLLQVERVILEKENYGFVSARMLHMELPEDEAILAYLSTIPWLDGNSEISFMRHELIGTYALVRTHRYSCDTLIVYVGEDGDIHSHQVGSVSDSCITYATGDVISELTVNDFSCRAMYNCDASEIEASEKHADFESPAMMQHNIYISPVVDDAVDSGWITFYCIDNLLFAKYNNKFLYKAVSLLSADEIQEVLDVCNEINDKLNAAIRSRIKKGKLSLGAVYRV